MIVATSSTSMLCIPGHWTARGDIANAMIVHGGLMLVGNMIFDPTNKQHFAVEITERDPAIAQAFAAAGQGRLPQDVLDHIAHHTFVLYISMPAGSLDTVRQLMWIGCHVGDAGGLAIKVESSGIAHTISKWRELAQDETPAALYRAYVVLVHRDDTHYSCGMHNLGYREAIADLEAFLGYTLLEHPTLEDGHTFSRGPNTTRCRLRSEPCTLYPDDWLFWNPYGMWHLSIRG
jgi:hypothetical protein